MSCDGTVSNMAYGIEASIWLLLGALRFFLISYTLLIIKVKYYLWNIVNDELEVKRGFMVYCGVLSWYLPGETKEDRG
jgi:hypothetical protein